jgi:N-acetyltransferase
LRVAAADGELWKIRYASVPEPENTRKYIEDAMRMHQDKKRVPFAVIESGTGRVLGSTSYHDLMPETHRIEIGYTWYAQSVQRTTVNTACKLLMMGCAFDALSAEFVGWRVDVLNKKSQVAVERLGAKREGVISNFGVRRDGTVRDLVFYGMRKAAWPAAKAKLLERLARSPSVAKKPDLRFLTLRQLKPEQLNALARLDAGAGNDRFVAPNGVSIANSIGRDNAHLLAMMLGDDPVGLMLIYDPSANADEAHADGAPSDTMILWRLMVDMKHQGKGYGRAALAELLRQARMRPGIDHIHLSHVPGEGSAGPLYEAFGFRYTGEEEDGELVMTYAL